MANAADEWPEVERRPETLSRTGSLRAGSTGRNTGDNGGREGRLAQKDTVRVNDPHGVVSGGIVGRVDNVGSVDGGSRGGGKGSVGDGVAGERRRSSTGRQGVEDGGRGVGDTGSGGGGGGSGGKGWDRGRREGRGYADTDKKRSDSSSSSSHAGRGRGRNEGSTKGYRGTRRRMNRSPGSREGESSDRGKGRGMTRGGGRDRDRDRDRDRGRETEKDRGRDSSRDRDRERERDQDRHRHRGTDRDEGRHRDRDIHRDRDGERGGWHGVDRWGDGGLDRRWRLTDGGGAGRSRSRDFGEPDGRSDDRRETIRLEEQQRLELTARAREMEEKVRWRRLTGFVFLLALA